MTEFTDEELAMIMAGLACHARQLEREARSRGLTGPSFKTARRNLLDMRDVRLALWGRVGGILRDRQEAAAR